MPTLDDAVAGVLGAAPAAADLQPAAPADPAAAAVDMVLGGERTRLRSTLMEAAQTPPDTAAKAVHAARQADVDFATALRNLTTLENRLVLERADKAIGEAPNLFARYFTQSDFAAMAQDDLDSLLGINAQVREHGALRAWRGPKPTVGSVASGLAQSMPQAFRAGREGMTLQMGEMLTALGLLESDPVAEREQLRRAEQAMGAPAYTTPDIEDPTLRAIYGGAASTLRAAPGIALSIAARNPVPGLAVAGMQTQAEAYPKYRVRGATQTQAALAGMAEGAVEVATELLPMGFLVNKFGKTGAREFIGGILARDVPTEQVATLLQDAIDTAVANPDKTWAEYLEERPGAAYQTLVSTITQSALMGGASAAVERLSRESNRQADADQDAQALDQLFAMAAGSKLRERDPQTFERFLQDVAEDSDGAPTSVWVDGEVLLQSLPPEKLAEVLPEVVQQAVEAAAIGGSVEIPVGAFAARLAGTGVEKALLPHLRTDPDALSQQEAKEAADAAADTFKQEAERLMAEAVDQDALHTSAEAVKATVLEQLAGAKRFKPEVNDAYASLVRDFYAATAARLGVSPEDLYARYPLRVAGATAEGGVLDDDGSRPTPEQRRFGVPFQPARAGRAAANPFDANRVMAPAEAKELAKSLGVKVELGDAAALSGADFFKALAKAAGGQPQALEALRAAGYDAIVTKPKNGEALIGSLEQSALQDGPTFKTAKEFDAWVQANATREADQFEPAQGDEGVALLTVRAGEKTVTYDGGMTGSQRVERDSSDVRLVYRLDDARLVWWDQATGKVGTVAPDDARLAFKPGKEQPPAAAREREPFEMVVEVDGEEHTLLLPDDPARLTDAEFADEMAMSAADDAVVAAYTKLRDERRGGTLNQSATESDAFREWFGDSRVVDAEGRPLVVYHGSPDARFLNEDGIFATMKERMLRWGATPESKRAAKEERGFFFTSSQGVARTYANPVRAFDYQNSEPAVISVYLAIRNPLVFDAKGKHWRDAQKEISKDDFIKEAKAKGHDGVVIRNVRDNYDSLQTGRDPASDVFVAFNSEQIKSATDNDGSFDANDPSILSQAQPARPPRGTFSPSQLQISLLENADLSTFLHETGHFFLEVLADLASQPNAPAQVQEDMGRALEWFGVKGSEQQTFARVAKRFGIPVEAVRDIAKTDAKTLIARSEEDERIPNNGESPAEFTRYPLGSVRMQPFGGDFANRYVDFLREFDPASLTTAEAEQGIKNHPTYARYVEWAEQGFAAPYISVYETDSGKLQSSNRRRTLVAQQLGKTAAGWFGPMNRETGLPLKYGDVLAAINESGTTPLAAWNAMTLDEKRPHHERFAESFEQYLLEGKAPSAELRPLFARFRSWLISVYKSLSDFTGRYQTKLSDEVRGVFDRLIATEAQIAEAQRLAGYEAVFKSAAEAGMTPEQWAAYQAKGEAATTAAVEELQKRSLRNLRWTVNARSRALKRLQAEAEDKRRAMRERVAAEVDEMPIMRARAFLDKATEATPEERDAAKDWRDRRAAALERFTEEVKAALMASPEAQGLKGLAKGQFIAKNRRSVANQAEAKLIAWERENPKPRREHPPVELQAVAELFGFPSGEALGRALVEEWSREETIDGLTEQRLLEAYGDMATPEGVARAADEAIHNEARARFVAAEMAAMQTATSTTTDTGRTASNGRPIRTSLVLQVARNTAELLIARRRIVDLKPSAFTGAETRAAKRGAQMQAAGNTAEAIAAKRDELFNHYAARYTMDAQAEVEKKLDYLRKFDKESVRKALPPEYLDQIDKLLERFDLRRSTTARDIDKRASLLAWVKEQEDLGLQPVVPDALLDEARSTSYKSLSVEEFRGLVDAVKNVEHLGRLKGKLLKAKDAREFAAIVEEIAASIRDNAVVEREARDNAPTAADRAVDTARDFFSMHRKLASIIRQLDGFKDAGPLWQVFGRTMNESADAEAVMREQATKTLAPIFERLLKTGNLRDTVTPPGVNKALSLETRLAIALNWGNEANRQRIMDGDRWSQQQVESILGTLTAEQLGIVQELWDTIDAYWPEIKAKEERVSGVAPEKVQAAPFTVNLTGGAKVEMRGGYYPIKYDPDKSAKAEADSAAEITRQMLQGQYTRATTRRGHTKARAETVNRTVRKDLGVVFEHVTQVAHDLTWHEWLIDANRLLRSGAIDAAIRETMGPETVREMRKALEDIAAGDVPAQSGFERAMNHLRTGVTVVGMGWNLMTSLMQPLGLTQSAVRIGPKWVAKGLARWIGDAARMENTAREVYAASDFMRLRGETMNREINEIRNKVQGKRFTAVEQSYFWLIQKAQLVADMPTWLGQYEKAMAEEADEARAVALADQAVRDAQGSGEIASLARIQRGGPLQKLFTNFYSYFSTTFNLTAERYRGTQFKDPLQAGRFAVDMLMLYTVPAVLGEAVRAAFTGGGDDDDGLAEKLVRAQANYLLGTMVGLRELGAAVNGFTGYQGPAGTRFFSEVAKLGKQVEQGEVDAAALKAANNTAGILFHYPAGQVNRTVEGFLAIQEGRTANPAALVFGPPRD